MMIISFAWTTPAVVLGVKNCTRRDWSYDYYLRMKKGMEKGEALQAYNKSPRNGGKCFGLVMPTSMMFEPTCEVPEQDWYNEGFEVLTELGLKTGKVTPKEIWNSWIVNVGTDLVTVRFKLVMLNEYGVWLKRLVREKLRRVRVKKIKETGLEVAKIRAGWFCITSERMKEAKTISNFEKAESFIEANGTKLIY